MAELVPAKRSKRQRIFVFLGVFGIVVLIAAGVFAKNDWFPRTDAMNGQKFGWFGKKLPKNAASSWNPLAPPSPTPTPQLSKEYIYAGSKLLAVEDANASAIPPADLAVWRPDHVSGYATWYVMGQTGSAAVTEGWGLDDDRPVPGDYDGDGKTDFSVFRPSNNKWYIRYSSDNSSSDETWGQTNDVEAPADYDGDGKTDRAVLRENLTTNLSTWYVLKSSDGNTFTRQWGITGDKPAPADYDGDGKADLAVWRNSNTNFYTIHSTDDAEVTTDFSASGKQVSSDYDGDGKADYALFYDPGSSTASWYIRSSISSTIGSAITFGNSGDTAVHNDYDADGKTDIAVWRSGTLAYWYIRQSAHSNSTRTEQWGIAGDTPVPAYYRR